MESPLRVQRAFFANSRWQIDFSGKRYIRASPYVFVGSFSNRANSLKIFQGFLYISKTPRRARRPTGRSLLILFLAASIRERTHKRLCVVQQIFQLVKDFLVHIEVIEILRSLFSHLEDAGILHNLQMVGNRRTGQARLRSNIVDTHAITVALLHKNQDDVLPHLVAKGRQHLLRLLKFQGELVSFLSVFHLFPPFPYF